MRKLSTVIVLLIMLLGISGCAGKRIVLVPQSEYYPTFNTSDFNVSKPYKIDFWIEEETIDNKTNTLMVAEKNNMMGFIRNTKELRSNYNILLRKINEFNQKIKELNKIQNEKKPIEVESVDSTWYK